MKYRTGVLLLFLAATAGAERTDEEICCTTCKAPRTKYYSIANDSGPWLCGETCIRDFFYPIFHIFEKNLTKASWTNSPCAEAGYTVYKETVTHGGGGLYCTLDLYACNGTDCPHPESSKIVSDNVEVPKRGRPVSLCQYESSTCDGEPVCTHHASGECFSVPNAFRTSSASVTCESNDKNSSWTFASSPYDYGCGGYKYERRGKGDQCVEGVVVRCDQ